MDVDGGNADESRLLGGRRAQQYSSAAFADGIVCCKRLNVEIGLWSRISQKMPIFIFAADQHRTVFSAGRLTNSWRDVANGETSPLPR